MKELYRVRGSLVKRNDTVDYNVEVYTYAYSIEQAILQAQLKTKGRFVFCQVNKAPFDSDKRETDVTDKTRALSKLKEIQHMLSKI